MTLTRRSVTTASLLGAPALFAVQRAGLAQISEMPPPSRTETQQIAIDAYVYGYSLMTTEVTRVQMSNVSKAEGLHAPTGQFINMKRYPPQSTVPSLRRMPIRSTRWAGSTSPSRRSLATRIWAIATFYSK